MLRASVALAVLVLTVLLAAAVAGEGRGGPTKRFGERRQRSRRGTDEHGLWTIGRLSDTRPTFRATPRSGRTVPPKDVPIRTVCSDGSPCEAHYRAVFSGGSFVRLRDAMRNLTGVVDTRLGYTGGFLKNPTYADVCRGLTGHAEAVQITYTQRTTFEALLNAFFACHDASQRDRFGNVEGTQFRSSVFAQNAFQHLVAKEAVATRRMTATVTTEVVGDRRLFFAETASIDELQRVLRDSQVVVAERMRQIVARRPFSILFTPPPTAASSIPSPTSLQPRTPKSSTPMPTAAHPTGPLPAFWGRNDAYTRYPVIGTVLHPEWQKLWWQFDVEEFVAFTHIPLYYATEPNFDAQLRRRFPEFYDVDGGTAMQRTNIKQYCRLTNPPASRDADSVCFKDRANWDRLHVVVTVTPDKSARWIDALPFRKVLYTKYPNMPRYGNRGGSLNHTHLLTWSSPLRKHHFSTPVLHRESPNLGDESLTVFQYIAEFYDHLPEYVLFNHYHQQSWHSMNVAKQLGCLRMDKRERIRTLTTISTAFFLHCIVRERRFKADIWPRNLDSAEPSPYDLAYKLFLEKYLGPQPDGFIHDCCSTFIVTREAIQALPRQFYFDVLAAMEEQPFNAERDGLGNDLGPIFERLWRVMFNATAVDFYRDFTNVRCQCKNRFHCPGAMSVASERDVPPDYRRECPTSVDKRFFPP